MIIITFILSIKKKIIIDREIILQRGITKNGMHMVANSIWLLVWAKPA